VTGFRHAVVGVDLAPGSGALTRGSLAALDHVRWLSQATALACTLLHSTAGDEHFDGGERGYRWAAGPAPREALEAAARDLAAAGVKAELEVTEERAWLAITRRVLRAPADLVIVGKRSETDPGGPRLGSQTQKLLRNCPCAVWAVGPGVAPPPRCILAATDLTQVGDTVLERAGRLARRAAAELHVVHAFQLSMEAQLRGEALRDAYVRRTTAHASERIRRGLAALDPDLAAHLHVGLASPTRAVLECCARLSPDLVVMGTVSRGGVAGLLVGNTAERLLPRLDTSLLTVKPADFVCPISPGEGA
jgi:universal stress protein E